MELSKGVQAFLYINLFLIAINGQCGLCDEKKVYEDIITANHYNTKVRPKHNHAESVNVDVDFELRQIISLDQVNQVIYFSGFIVAEWEDEYLKWDPTQYGGTTNVVIPPSDIWLPDFGIINSADTFYQSTFSTDFRAHIYHTGHVIWSFGGNFATSCELDLTYFPFDRQICNITLENWAYNNDQVALKNKSDYIHKDDFHKNGEWELEHTSVVMDYIYHDLFPGKPYPKVTFNMYLRRKAGYYSLNIMAPCFYIIGVALAIFWLPADSGEKVGVGITVLLAFSVFQLVLADNSPKTSDFYPVLTTYVSFVMGMSAVSTTTAILCLYFHHHLASKPIPTLVKVIFFKYIGRALCMMKTLPDVESENAVEPGRVGNEEGVDSSMELKGMEAEITRKKNLTQAEVEIVDHLQYVTDRMKAQDVVRGIEDDWKALARVMDRIFFYICTVIIIIACLVMLTKVQPPLYTQGND